MKKLAKKAKSLLRSEDATAATEYAVMLGLIVVVAVTAITLLGTNARDLFASSSADLSDGNGPTT